MLPDVTENVLENLAVLHMREFLLRISQEQLLEREVEDVYNGDENLARYVPGVVNSPSWGAWLTRNKTAPNAFRRGIERLITPLTTAELQWTGDEDWTDAQRDAAKGVMAKFRAMIPNAALDLALKGKSGILPWWDGFENRLTLFAGFLFPMWDEGDLLELERLLVFQTVQGMKGKVEYVVWEIEDGLVNVYTDVTVAVNYQSGAKSSYEMKHAPKRSPCAFATFSRDANRSAEGIGIPALGAHYAYRQRHLQLNASYELVGMPQRVYTGMEGDETGTTTSFAPFQNIYLPTGAAMSYPFPSESIAALEHGVEAAKAAVGTALHAPEPGHGASASGESRLMSLEELVEATGALGNVVAHLFTDTTELMAAMGWLPSPLTFSLQPEFSSGRAAAQQNITNLFEKGLLSRYAALVLLQQQGLDIPEDELDAALSEFQAASVPPAGVPGLEPAPTELAPADTAPMPDPAGMNVNGK